MTPVDVRWLTAFLDRPAGSFDAATRFWLQVSGTTLSATRGPHDQFATLIPDDGDAFLRVQRVVDGPGGCHLDVHVDDIPEAAMRAVGLGATKHEELDDVSILRSPAGLAFCIVRHHGESTRPRPHALRDTESRTAIDQLCVDIAPDAYERECGFWEAFTGWERRPARLPEFSYLERPEHIPLRLLLQRLDDADHPHTAGTHLDLACENRDVAVIRHVALGARVETRHEYWTTMTDPSGLPYCLTRRNPDTGLLDTPT
jgi:hypothetical protein